MNRVFHKYWGNLPDKLLSFHPIFKILFFYLALSYPIFAILALRFDRSFIYLYDISQFIAFAIAFFVHQQFRTGNNTLKNIQEKGIMYNVSKIISFYIAIPLCIVFAVQPLFVNPVMMLFSTSNPQNLPVGHNSNLLLDVLSVATASGEELWRIAMIVSCYYLLMKLNKNASLKLKWLFIFISIIISSIIFGWLHTFGYTNGWFSLEITVILGVSGFVYALMIFLTRRVWTVIISHSLFNICSTIFRSQYKDEFSTFIIITLFISLMFLLFYLALQFDKDRKHRYLY